MLNHRRILFGVVLLLVAGILACNGGPAKPTVEILSPPTGTQVALGDQVEVEYRATDAVAVVRVDLEVNDEVVDSQSSPVAEGQPSMSGVLRWTPTEDGSYTLLVYAYNRDRTPSDPVGVNIITQAPGAPTATQVSPTQPPPTQPPPTQPPTQPPPTQPPPTQPPPTQPPPTQPPTASLVLHNNSGGPACYVYFSPPGQPWGDDQLDAAETVADGQSRTWQITPGTYDMKAEDCAHNVLDQRMGVNVSGTYNWTIAPSLANLVLQNNSGVTVCFVYFSPPGEPWGNDQLGADTVPFGGTYTWQVTPGTYDLKAEDCGGQQLDVRGSVNVSGTYNWTIAPSQAALFLQNNSGVTVCYVYFSPPGEPWGDDRLGAAETVADGASRTWQVTPGTYDMKAEDCAHNVLDDRRGVNVSGTYNWTIGP